MHMAKRPKMRGTKTLDPATVAFRARARDAGMEAMAGLLDLAKDAKSEAVKLAAIKELLDRGFGRAAASESPADTIAHVMVDDGYAK
jgi:hypothetical protein